jgi:Ca2+-binding EF-hand superfamily protein
MTPPRSAILLAAAAFMFVQMSSAASQQDPSPSSLRWFDSFDQNRDGVLTPEEVESTSTVQFVRIDADSSGTLTVDEYLAANPDSDDEEVRKSRDRFTVMDRRGDGNGEATPAEFVNFGKFVIEIADFNADGRLSRQEFIDGITRPPPQ